MTKIGYPLLLVSNAAANIVNLAKIGSPTTRIEQGSVLAGGCRGVIAQIEAAVGVCVAIIQPLSSFKTSIVGWLRSY